MLDVIQARERGLSFPDILRTISPSYSMENLRKVWRKRNNYTSLAAAGTRSFRENGGGSEFGSMDKRIYDWSLSL